MAYQPPIGSTVAFQSDPTKLLTHASVSGNVNIAGSIVAFQSGAWTTSIVGGVSILGGAVSLAPTSVATLQGTNPWIVQIITSVAAVQMGAWNIASMSGVYAEDAGHTSADKGLFNLGVRNDAVASFTSANLDYSPIGTDSAGRILIKPFAPNEAYISGVSSTVNTNPSSLLTGDGAGLRNYITDVLIANTGSVSTLVSFRDGDASVIAKTIAPAGGGSNFIGLQIPMRTGGFNQSVEFTAGTATSILHITAFGFKAP